MHFARGGSLWELQQAGKTFFNGPNGKIISCFDQGKYPRLFCEALQHLLYLAMPKENLLWIVVIFLISDSFFSEELLTSAIQILAWKYTIEEKKSLLDFGMECNLIFMNEGSSQKWKWLSNSTDDRWLWKVFLICHQIFLEANFEEKLPLTS